MIVTSVVSIRLLFLDGVYLQNSYSEYGFRRNPPSTVEQLRDLLPVICQRVVRWLMHRSSS
ncbi:MAG: hypothetical protein R3F41_12070 [Gammaproteobacteria bacterium]|nr:hypothetical protein [Pseudomonadales bacterium]MCP5348833.1 hypothetical protein [Pseudomonadales bacterium]